MGIWITVAPGGYTGDAQVDFICAGTHDERTLQAAVDRAVAEGKNVFLRNGVYRIDGFCDPYGDGGPETAVCIPNAWREVKLVGENSEYGFQKNYRNGVVLYVSPSALDGIRGETDVLRGQWTGAGIQNGSSLCLEGIAVVLADNAHAIRCIDLRRTDRVEVKNVTLLGYGDALHEDSTYGLDTPPDVPARGCIGLTMTDGSNNSYSNYMNVQTYGFDEGIQVGGEHVVMINCGATSGRYGFTFGNYEVNCGANHPITLINCMDERNIHLPLFNRCGDSDGRGGRLQGGQEVTLISFNMERVERQTPGGRLGDLMREVYPGTWRGSIDYTLQPDWCCTNSVGCRIWAADGSGSGIRTRNRAHKTVCTTAERLGYFADLGEQVFDLDLGRAVICVDPDTQRWVDCLGQEV